MLEIVCGTDLTDNAALAERAAAAWAKVLGAALAVVHVVEEEDVDDGALERRRGVVEERAARLRERWPGLVVGVEALRGDVAEVLVERTRGCAALVVGAQGQRKRGRWIVGRHSERIAQVAPVPVVVVRDATVFEGWARGDEPLAVTLGLDPSRTSRAALAWVEGLGHAAPIRVNVVHVASPRWEAIRLGLRDAPDDHLTKDAEDILRRDLCRWMGEKYQASSVSMEIVAGRRTVEEQLASAAARSGVLVVGTHQRAPLSRAWYGSVSRGALLLCGNVALVPPGAAASVAPEPPTRPRRILVPVDFSAASTRAAAYAHVLAADGASVHLLHVITPLAHAEEPDEVLRTRMLHLAPASPGDREAATTAEVLHARSVADGIWHVAERIGADLVCMPSRARLRPFSAVGPGATTRAVIARSTCPVVVTPPVRDE
jgi:nucleotide-binding universal stress UspA family protein